MSYDDKHHLRDGDIVLYRRNGSPTFHARLKIPDVKGYIIKSTKRKSLNDAVRIAEDLYDDLRYKARHGLEVRSHNFGSVYRRWVENHKANLSVARFRYIDGTAQRYFIPFLGERNVESINDGVISEYWVWRRNYWNSPEGVRKIETAKRSRTTIKRPYKQKLGNVARTPSQKTLEMEQSALRQILSWAQRLGIMNRVPEIKAPRTTFRKEISRRPAFELSEWRALYRFLRGWSDGKEDGKTARLNSSHLYHRRLIRSYILFMTASGLRPNEARQLRWKDVGQFIGKNGKTQTVLHISPSTKTGERKCIPLQPVRVYLDRVHAISTHTEPSDLVFCNRDGEPVENFGKTFKDVLLKANLLKDNWGRTRTIYSLRHTYATLRLLYGKDVNIEDLAQNMGTSPTQIFKHYRHITVLQIADKLGGVVNPEMSTKGLTF